VGNEWLVGICVAKLGEIGGYKYLVDKKLLQMLVARLGVTAALGFESRSLSKFRKLDENVKKWPTQYFSPRNTEKIYV